MVINHLLIGMILQVVNDPLTPYFCREVVLSGVSPQFPIFQLDGKNDVCPPRL